MKFLDFKLESVISKQSACASYLYEILSPYMSNNSDSSCIPPYLDDLSFLYALIDVIKPNSVLEYGCGYSSLSIYASLINNYSGDGSPVFYQIIEAHQSYINIALERIKKTSLNGSQIIVDAAESDIVLDRSRSDGSHHYTYSLKRLPDFIYLDAPDPADITDTCFTDQYQRPPISSDLLQYESMLEPGTFLLIDGRTLNYRYLRSRVLRNWLWFELNDRFLGYIDEPPLGARSAARLKQRHLLI